MDIEYLKKKCVCGIRELKKHEIRVLYSKWTYDINRTTKVKIKIPKTPNPEITGSWAHEHYVANYTNNFINIDDNVEFLTNQRRSILDTCKKKEDKRIVRFFWCRIILEF